jgi:putative membrane protein
MVFYRELAPVNAALNTIAAILLLAGFAAIKYRRVSIHRACMLSAFVVSMLFLVSYLTYHYQVGDVRFAGRGWVRPAYFTMLTSHIILAAAIVPLAIVTLVRALRGRFAAHRRIARWAWPIWMYVSVTGVLVYLMVYVIYGPPLGMARGPDGTGILPVNHYSQAGKPVPPRPRPSGTIGATVKGRRGAPPA